MVAAVRQLPTAESMLPQNVEAEACVLGSLLIDEEAMAEVADLLSPDDFYREEHRHVFEARHALFEAGSPGDLITLTDELARRGKLDEVGGVSFVSTLANQVPTSANVLHYARIVERTATMRRLIHAAGQIASVAYNAETDATVACDLALAELLRVTARHSRQQGDVRSFADWLDELHEDVLARMDLDAPPGVRTGFGALDTHLLGIEPGELVYLAGRPGSGKSALGLRVALNAAFECRRLGRGTVDVVTMEMTPAAQSRRLVAGLAELNTRAIRAGFRGPNGNDLDAYERFQRAWRHYRDEVGSILYLHRGAVSLAQLRARALHAVTERGLRLLVIDQLDLMAEHGKDEYQRVTTISRELKQMALSVGVAIICLVQLNREVEKRQNKRPMLADLRQSGQLEQDADMVWGLYRPSYYEPEIADPRFQQYAEVLLLKVRDGESGISLPLRYEKEFTRFSDWPFDEVPVQQQSAQAQATERQDQWWQRTE